ncbi:MAG: hypothetical protein JXB88_18985 [Spirochaetales bacterium]|nr:hypothetical protein [Spirochaetales bacterium]
MGNFCRNGIGILVLADFFHDIPPVHFPVVVVNMNKLLGEISRFFIRKGKEYGFAELKFMGAETVRIPQPFEAFPVIENLDPLDFYVHFFVQTAFRDVEFSCGTGKSNLFSPCMIYGKTCLFRQFPGNSPVWFCMNRACIKDKEDGKYKKLH